MSFWDGLNAGDMFEQAVGAYVETEKARAQNTSQTQIDDQNELLNRPDHVTQSPNATPQSPGKTEVSAGTGAGAGRNIVLPGGMELNRTAVYVAGAALGTVLVLKYMK